MSTPKDEPQEEEQVDLEATDEEPAEVAGFAAVDGRR